MDVEYRDIKGYPGYRVGNDGSVWSCWTRPSPKGSRIGAEEFHVSHATIESIMAKKTWSHI